MLVYLQQEATAPFYATALLLIINQFTLNRLSLEKLMLLIASTGKLMAELSGILAAIGLIIGSLAVTGMAGTLANDLVYIAGDNVVVLLVMGAVTSFVLGIGMTVTAAYIFLAIILAPALINAGLDPLASHMFIMYWGMLNFITPPVALSAFAAASVAQCSPMRVGFEAMRLGAIIYFIPFFFVFNPAMLLQGTVMQILPVLITAIIGVTLVSAGLRGYLVGFGKLGDSTSGLFVRFILCIAGLMFAIPGGGILGLSQLMLTSSGLIIAMIALGVAILQRRQQAVASLG